MLSVLVTTIRNCVRQRAQAAFANGTRGFAESRKPIVVSKRGNDLFHDPWYNKVSFVLSFTYPLKTTESLTSFHTCKNTAITNRIQNQNLKNQSEQGDLHGQIMLINRFDTCQHAVVPLQGLLFMWKPSAGQCRLHPLNT